MGVPRVVHFNGCMCLKIRLALWGPQALRVALLVVKGREGRRSGAEAVGTRAVQLTLARAVRLLAIGARCGRRIKPAEARGEGAGLTLSPPGLHQHPPELVGTQAGNALPTCARSGHRCAGLAGQPQGRPAQRQGHIVRRPCSLATAARQGCKM